MLDDILALERSFWNADSAFFAANTDANCMLALPSMAGTATNEELAATASNPTRWTSVEIELKGWVDPLPGMMLIVYEANAVRDTGEPYTALVSSGYVRRDDGWKLMFHSQSPTEG